MIFFVSVNSCRLKLALLFWTKDPQDDSLTCNPFKLQLFWSLYSPSFLCKRWMNHISLFWDKEKDLISHFWAYYMSPKSYLSIHKVNVWDVCPFWIYYKVEKFNYKIYKSLFHNLGKPIFFAAIVTIANTSHK